MVESQTRKKPQALIKSPRFNENEQFCKKLPVDVPGPGQYESSMIELKGKEYKVKAFGTENRFQQVKSPTQSEKPTSRGTKGELTSAGTSRTAKNNSTLVKKTFNVTMESKSKYNRPKLNKQ